MNIGGTKSSAIETQDYNTVHGDPMTVATVPIAAVWDDPDRDDYQQLAIVPQYWVSHY